MARRFVYFQGSPPLSLEPRHYLGLAASGNTIPQPPSLGDFYSHLLSGRLFRWTGAAWEPYSWLACEGDNCSYPSPSTLPTVEAGAPIPPVVHYLSQDFEDNAVPREGLNVGDFFTNEGTARLYTFTGTTWQPYRWKVPISLPGFERESCEDEDPPPYPPGNPPTYMYSADIDQSGTGGNPGPCFGGFDGSLNPIDICGGAGGFDLSSSGWGWVFEEGGDYPDPDPEAEPPTIPRQTQPNHFPYSPNGAPRKLGDFTTTLGGQLQWFDGSSWQTYPWLQCP